MQIGEALANCKQPFVSFEFFPPQDSATLPEFYQVVRKLGTRNPLFVSVTYGAGGGKQQNTLAITAKLVEMGFLTMAHLTCVGAERTSIGNFLESLRFHGVTNVLALRGDAPQDGSWQPGMAEFKHAIDLVRFIKQEQPDFGIGVAAYPTPHPEANTYEEDRSYTAQKIAAGADVVITQLFFDVRDYFALVAELRAKGCSAPIIPGILPLQSFGALKRILSLSGAHIPGKLYLQLEAADKAGGPKAVQEAGLVFASEQIKRLIDGGVPGIHLYTLNKAEICLELLERAQL